jgi:transcriptional regulator with XRE-family HTH domain
MQGLCGYNVVHDSNPTEEVRLRLPRLKQWRENRGLTQQELANRIGSARDTISKWETGERGAQPANAKKLADVLNVEVRDLAEDFASWISRVHSIPELRRIARDLNAEWRELAAYDRPYKRPYSEQDVARLAEIGRKLDLIAKRLDELDPPLCRITHRPGEPPKVQFHRTPTDEEEDELKGMLGNYEVVEDFALV